MRTKILIAVKISNTEFRITTLNVKGEKLKQVLDTLRSFDNIKILRISNK